MEEENTLTSNEIYFEKVEDEHGLELTLEENLRNNFVGLLMNRYENAQRARELDEKRWITAYHNYRGLYPKNVRFRESEKSRVFVKVTKTKVLAAFGQLVDVIFGANKFPIGISETKVPEGIAEHAHLDTNNPTPNLETTSPEEQEEIDIEEGRAENPYDVGYVGDGRTLKPGATLGTGKFEEQFLDKEGEDKGMLREGLSPIPEILELNPAERSARRMEKLIHDQIEESNGASEIRNALFESALFGTGIVKGPFNFNKTLSRWEEDEEGGRTYSPIDVLSIIHI